ncbi:MAG TPA: hypothetical protein VMS17_12830 [Gemmataceae bacterium]|nr:hypothetical protein [Gemmataceae bacterium]
MIQLPQIKTRIIRLCELIEGLGREVNRWKSRESVLLLLERRRYLDKLQGAFAALDDARHVLAVAARRLETQRP